MRVHTAARASLYAFAAPHFHGIRARKSFIAEARVRPATPLARKYQSFITRRDAPRPARGIWTLTLCRIQRQLRDDARQGTAIGCDTTAIPPARRFARPSRHYTLSPATMSLLYQSPSSKFMCAGRHATTTFRCGAGRVKKLGLPPIPRRFAHAAGPDISFGDILGESHCTVYLLIKRGLFIIIYEEARFSVARRFLPPGDTYGYFQNLRHHEISLMT